jgi:hypothetical protein
MNAYIRAALVVLGALAVAVQTSYPHASWAVMAGVAVTSVLAALHIPQPTTPAARVRLAAPANLIDEDALRNHLAAQAPPPAPSPTVASIINP